MTFERPVYPFTAIVGQERLKLVLILNAIDPDIGGVLFTGAKGTGKSLTLRSFVDILPEIEVVEECDFNCNPYDPTNMCESCSSGFKEGKALPRIRKKMKIVQIPISATEDRVMGTIDVEKTLREGVKGLQPGLLAEANQNILYIDEVNLLPDHLVDMLLDSAASGWNVIEREGISVAHPSRFILIGSMNPEEGELRPQILDRFALHVKADNLLDHNERVEVIKRNLEFDKNPSAFLEKYQGQQEKLRQRITVAKKLLHKVKVQKSVLASVAKVSSELHVDGSRPDIVMVRAVRALVAFNGRTDVKPEDVRVASELSLSHRSRRSGSLAPPSSKEIKGALKTTTMGEKTSKITKIIDFFGKIRLRYVAYILAFTFIIFLLMNVLAIFTIRIVQRLYVQLSSSVIYSREGFIISSLAAVLTAIVLKGWFKRVRRRLPSRLLDFAKIVTEHELVRQVVVEESDESARFPVEVDYKGKTALEQGQRTFRSLPQPPNKTEVQKGRIRSSRGEHTRRGRGYLVGKRAKVVASTNRGRYVWYELPREHPWDMAFGPTIRAAAPYQPKRKPKNMAVAIETQDVRVKMREYRAPFSIVLLVDMSWSMINCMENLGRAIYSLHRSVYRRRDRVGLIVFKGSGAFIIQQPTTNLNLVIRKLFKVRASDYTPLAAGMLKSWKVLRLEKQRNKDAVPMLIIVSDGITNIPLKTPLSAHTRQRFLSAPQADVIDVSRLIARDGIRTFMINTSHREAEMTVEKEAYAPLVSQTLFKYTPTRFLMEVAKLTGGSYYGLSMKKEGELFLKSERPRLEDWFYLEEGPHN